mgnify:CR=1 FL=1
MENYAELAIKKHVVSKIQVGQLKVLALQTKNFIASKAALAPEPAAITA